MISQSSAGALRAAKIIDKHVLRFDKREIEARPVEWLAEVIDEQCAAGAAEANRDAEVNRELIEALRERVRELEARSSTTLP